MIVYGSRYVSANVIGITTTAGLSGLATVLDRKPFTVDDLENGWNYRTMSHERDLDLTAFMITGRESLWFLIADVNQILDPFEVIPAGRQLIVPTKQSFEDIKRRLNESV